MSGPMLAVSLLVGWCGTPWPRRWPWPPPGPDPDPWLTKVIGLVGGVVGGWVFNQYIDTSLVMAAVGAWLGSVLLNEIVGLGRGGLARK
ncbi:MAG: hypothetical protein OEZ02_15675 [Anaerolineae bacterium]|nr:hypothetical protein [Anaerolineae bacterium]